MVYGYCKRFFNSKRHDIKNWTKALKEAGAERIIFELDNGDGSSEMAFENF